LYENALKTYSLGFSDPGIDWQGRNFDPGSQKIFAGYPGGQKIKFFQKFLKVSTYGTQTDREGVGSWKIAVKNNF
jgi:hypothetical protein